MKISEILQEYPEKFSPPGKEGYWSDLNINPYDPRYELYKDALHYHTKSSKLLNSTLHTLYRNRMGGRIRIDDVSKDQIQMLDDIMSNHPLQKSIKVYTGVPESPLRVWDASGQPKNKPIRVHLPAYTSTSPSFGIAAGFSRGDRQYGGDRSILLLEVPAGIPGLDLSRYSEWGDEEEVLLARGLDVEIYPNPESVRTSSSEVTIWKAKVVGHTPTKYKLREDRFWISHG